MSVTRFFLFQLPDQRAEQGNIAELSPGAVGAGGAGGGGGGARAEHQAAINSMMMERMSTDIYALKKQYVRIKRRQQQQAMQLYIRTGGRKKSNSHHHSFLSLYRQFLQFSFYFQAVTGFTVISTGNGFSVIRNVTHLDTCFQIGAKLK